VILVDTSVWVDHLRSGDAALAARLDDGNVLMHPFVLGELALGSLRRRETVLALLRDLPAATPATDAEVLHFVDAHRLWGRGIGWVDAHLLAAARLTAGAAVWSRDRSLAAVGRDLGLLWDGAT